MQDFQGKTVVITGGSSGIGLATARLFQARGARVITSARNAQRQAETRAEHGGVYDDILVADVSRVGELEQFYREVGERYGKIDVLFLNAGIAYFMPIEAMSEELFDRQFATNVKGVFFGVQKALPYLEEGASVLITTSVVNQIGMPNSNAYAATKAAVKSLTQTLAAELVGRKIRVNAISPGPIETPIYGKMGLSEELVAEMAGGILSQVPVGRFGTSEEVAEAALFLAGNHFVTGTEVVVDGGMSQLN